jgi:hypothetical protein
MSLTLVLSVCGAFATRPHFDCSNMTQYFFVGGGYTPAGIEGVDYTCASGSTACTYYTNDGIHFAQCQVGTYCTANCFIRQNDKSVKPVQKPVPTAAH